MPTFFLTNQYFYFEIGNTTTNNKTEAKRNRIEQNCTRHFGGIMVDLIFIIILKVCNKLSVQRHFRMKTNKSLPTFRPDLVKTHTLAFNYL